MAMEMFPFNMMFISDLIHLHFHISGIRQDRITETSNSQYQEVESLFSISVFRYIYSASSVTKIRRLIINSIIRPMKVGRIMIWRMSSVRPSIRPSARPSVNISLFTGVTTCRINLNFPDVIHLVHPIHDTGNGPCSSINMCILTQLLIFVFWPFFQIRAFKFGIVGAINILINISPGFCDNRKILFLAIV